MTRHSCAARGSIPRPTPVRVPQRLGWRSVFGCCFSATRFRNSATFRPSKNLIAGSELPRTTDERRKLLFCENTPRQLLAVAFWQKRDRTPGAVPVLSYEVSLFRGDGVGPRFLLPGPRRTTLQRFTTTRLGARSHLEVATCGLRARQRCRWQPSPGNHRSPQGQTRFDLGKTTGRTLPIEALGCRRAARPSRRNVQTGPMRRTARSQDVSSETSFPKSAQTRGDRLGSSQSVYTSAGTRSPVF